MSKNEEIQFEIDRDVANRLVAEEYVSKGYGLHFHRNVEIYGVVDGEVLVTIAGDKRLLKSGQMAIANGMEVHEYAIQNEAEIFYLHIGTSYLSVFISLYKNNLLPRWLLDTEYNKRIYDQIKELFNYDGKLSELKKYGFCNNLLADIVSGYGVASGVLDNKSLGYIEQVIQYIYDHYSENITAFWIINRWDTSSK